MELKFLASLNKSINKKKYVILYWRLSSAGEYQRRYFKKNYINETPSNWATVPDHFIVSSLDQLMSQSHCCKVTESKLRGPF
jgi:hypothetical protein